MAVRLVPGPELFTLVFRFFVVPFNDGYCGIPRSTDGAMRLVQDSEMTNFEASLCMWKDPKFTKSTQTSAT